MSESYLDTVLRIYSRFAGDSGRTDSEDAHMRKLLGILRAGGKDPGVAPFAIDPSAQRPDEGIPNPFPCILGE